MSHKFPGGCTSLGQEMSFRGSGKLPASFLRFELVPVKVHRQTSGDSRDDGNVSAATSDPSVCTACILGLLTFVSATCPALSMSP